MSETVQIKDSEGTWLKLEISTANRVRVSWSESRVSVGGLFRPGGIWKGDWSATDKGLISCVSGEVWYTRSAGDISNGVITSDVQHIDIFLFKEGITDGDDWIIRLYTFLCPNGINYSTGDGYINQKWVLQMKPGSCIWDIRERK